MKTYTVNQIADYFLFRSDESVGDLLSNLKLQKMCYYSAGVINAVRNLDEKPLFEERIEAWTHGPVVPELYRRFRDNGSSVIPELSNYDTDLVDDADQSVLDDVYNFYGQFSAWKLRDMTHEESPWIDAKFRGENFPITREALRAHFINEVGPKYIKSYREKVQAV